MQDTGTTPTTLVKRPAVGDRLITSRLGEVVVTAVGRYGEHLDVADRIGRSWHNAAMNRSRPGRTRHAPAAGSQAEPAGPPSAKNSATRARRSPVKNRRCLAQGRNTVYWRSPFMAVPAGRRPGALAGLPANLCCWAP